MTKRCSAVFNETKKGNSEKWMAISSQSYSLAMWAVRVRAECVRGCFLVKKSQCQRTHSFQDNELAVYRYKVDFLALTTGMFCVFGPQPVNGWVPTDVCWEYKRRLFVWQLRQTDFQAYQELQFLLFPSRRSLFSQALYTHWALPLWITTYFHLKLGYFPSWADVICGVWRESASVCLCVNL